VLAAVHARARALARVALGDRRMLVEAFKGWNDAAGQRR